jgi:signal transduction histidine kinase/DNA-binding NarL/FixJ family response regulator
MTAPLLIADGSEASAIRIREVLVDLGYDARVVRTADEVLQVCPALSPAALLASHDLPDMDTRELLDILRQSKPELEIIVVCPRRSLAEQARRFKPLVAGLLGRPIRPDETELLLRGVMERVRLRRQLQQEKRETARRLRRRYVKRIETERFLTVKQILDKVSTFIGELAREVEGGVRYFNEIPYLIAIHDRKCRVVAANRAYRTLLGRRLGDPSWEIYDGEARSRERCPVGRTLLSENALDLRETVRYRSGAKVPVIVHTAPIYNDDGTVKLVMEVSAGTRDIGRLKEDLRNTQQRYQLLFDAVPCYVAVLDREMRFTANNRRFIDEFGDRTGVPFREVFPIDPEKLKSTPMRRTFHDGKPHHGEMTLPAPGGRRYKTLVWTSPLFSAAGKLLQVLLIFIDVTQIQDLKNNLAFLGLMIASISHSVKGVLSGLDAGVYILSRAMASGDGDRVQEGLELVQHMAERIRKITLDILYYAKERALNCSAVDLQRFARDVVETVRPRFKRLGIRLDCDDVNAAGAFTADAGLLKAAMVNFLENAVDACVADSKDKTEHRVVLKCESNPDAVAMSVEDNGMGMTPEQLKRLFTVFYSTKGIKGTGLGLFIADQIIRQHGGDIVVESSLGQGSRFCVRLPRSPAPEAPGSETAYGQDHSDRRRQ